ncbi:MAG: hypothetical protein WEG56_11490 [Chloroflexota bacterium]
MDWLFADVGNAYVEGVGLLAALIGSGIGTAAGSRAGRSANPVIVMYWRDLSRAAYVWTGATGATVAGSLIGIEGLRMPALVIVEIVIAGVATLVAWRSWHSDGLRLVDRLRDPAASGSSRRLESRAWEVGLLAAGIGGVVAYGASVAHPWAHPMHWIIAVVGAGLGYAAGLVVATPRFVVRLRDR